MEYSLKRVHTGKDLAISATILLAGIGLFFVNKGLGICIGICGVLMCLFYKGGYKKDGRGILLSKKSEDICKECRSSIMEFLEGKNAKPELKQGNNGGSIRIEIISIKLKKSHTYRYMISATTTMNLRPASSNSMATGRKN